MLPLTGAIGTAVILLVHNQDNTQRTREAGQASVRLGDQWGVHLSNGDHL